VDDAADSLRSMFADIISIDDHELDIPPEESLDVFETVETAVEAALAESDAMVESMVSGEADLYTPGPEPMTVERAVDAAIAESALFSSAAEEGMVEDFADVLEAEKVVAAEGGEELGEDFDDEDFSEGEHHLRLQAISTMRTLAMMKISVWMKNSMVQVISLTRISARSATNSLMQAISTMKFGTMEPDARLIIMRRE